MSLNWNLSKIKNSDDLCWTGDASMPDDERRTHHITDGLIWACMGVGLGQITAKNYPEFFARCQLQTALNGPPFWQTENGVRTPRDFTLAEIKAHIGLSTNISDESTAKWTKRITADYLHRTENAARHSEKEVAAA